jgi:glycosyltransferase involved in cell wall biosynthesis
VPHTDAKERILVFVPAYRCATQVRRVIRQLDAHAALMAVVDGVLIVDNCSPDDTFGALEAEIASSLHRDKFVALRNHSNLGLGGSHKIAFRYARKHGFHTVAVLHGDDQAKTTDLLTLIHFAKVNPHLEAVLGSRFLPASQLVRYSTIRTLGNWALNMAYSALTARWISDLGAGLNLYRVTNLTDTTLEKFSDSYLFTMDHLLHLVRVGAQFTYFSITWRHQDEVSNIRSVEVALKALIVLLRWRLGLR